MPGINKIKKLNFLNKNKSKILLVLTKAKEKNISVAKKSNNNNQARQIICLFMVSRYYLHFLFIKCFSCQDKVDCSIKNLRAIAWTKWNISKKQCLCQNATGVL